MHRARFELLIANCVYEETVECRSSETYFKFFGKPQNAATLVQSATPFDPIERRYLRSRVVPTESPIGTRQEFVQQQILN